MYQLCSVFLFCIVGQTYQGCCKFAPSIFVLWPVLPSCCKFAPSKLANLAVVLFFMHAPVGVHLAAATFEDILLGIPQQCTSSLRAMFPLLECLRSAPTAPGAVSHARRA